MLMTNKTLTNTRQASMGEPRPPPGGGGGIFSWVYDALIHVKMPPLLLLLRTAIGKCSLLNPKLCFVLPASCWQKLTES